MAITSAMALSYKAELAQAIHNHTVTTGDVFKVALIKSGMAGTYGKTTSNYSDVTGNSDEVASGNGYTTGGFSLTAAQNVTPLAGTTGAYWSFTVNPSWVGSGAGFSCAGAILYNSSKANRAVGVIDFGGTVSIGVSVTLSIALPANAEGSSICQIN